MHWAILERDTHPLYAIPIDARGVINNPERATYDILHGHSFGFRRSCSSFSASALSLGLSSGCAQQVQRTKPAARWRALRSAWRWAAVLAAVIFGKRSKLSRHPLNFWQVVMLLNAARTVTQDQLGICRKHVSGAKQDTRRRPLGALHHKASVSSTPANALQLACTSASVSKRLNPPTL